MDCSTTNQMFDKNNKLTRTYFLDTYYRRRSITGDGLSQSKLSNGISVNTKLIAVV